MSESGWELRRRRVAHDIEEIALACFARDGYHAVTVEQIAQAAGIHERTFFRYFASKDDVMLALPRRSIEALASSLRNRPEEESLYEAFVSAVREAATQLMDDTDLRVVSVASSWKRLIWSPVPLASSESALGFGRYRGRLSAR